MTDEEKRLIVNTPIDESCFEKWEDYHYEEIRLEHFEYPNEKWKKCTLLLYPTTIYESIIRDCEAIRQKYIKTKNEHYFDILVHLLPQSYKGAKEWHNLQKDPTDLPQCEEDEQIIFYVKEWYEDIQKHRNHYCLGFYKKAFLNDDVKVFVEKSKGYENEHLPATVLRWRVLEMGD